MSSSRKPSSWRQYVGAGAGVQREGERSVEVCAGLVEPVGLVRDDAEQRPAGADDLRHARRGGRVECLGEQPPGRPEVLHSLMGEALVEELQDPLPLVRAPRLAHPTATPYQLRPGEGDRLNVDGDAGTRADGERSGADVGREVLAADGGAGGDQVGRRALEHDPAASWRALGPRSMIQSACAKTA